MLNALDLEIHRARADGTAPAFVNLDEAAQTLTLEFKQPLRPGPHQLTLDYSGKIYRTASGFFAVDYPADGGTKRMLTTQFEVGDARRFAPMWDEPATKATFALEVIVPKGQSAYSNMPVASSSESNGKETIRFAVSPKMSSYLLHLTVGELERISRTVAGVDIGVVTRKGASEKGRTSLDAAAEILPWYNDYFATPYPLPKLDMIAVPGSSQFFGAMENWGAIMYFEPALLVDPRLSSESQRMEIFDAVAHEMAHQWFGNLVTMNWWDELWLNEGYATWMAHKVASALRPGWDTALADVSWTRERAMQSDAGDATHPIVQPVSSVETANQAFDSIAYSKGSLVIRMIEATAGEAGFREGIRRYMRKYAYGNAVTEQLWAELAAATSQPLIDIARDFTLQPGVPLVKIASGPCESGRSRVTLSQGRFEAGTPSPTRLTWRVPVRLLALDTGRTAEALLGKDGASVTAQLEGCGPVVANAGQAGYFRTQYADPEFGRLRASFSRMTDVDRLGLLNDTAALARNGTIGATRYLELSEGVPEDSHPFILLQLAEQFASIDRLMDGSVQQEQWRRFARDRLRPIFDRIGWSPVKGEAETVALLRESLIGSLSRLEDPSVLAGARDRFLRSSTDASALPASIYDPVLEVAATHADASTWEQIRRRAKGATDPREQQQLYAALGLSRDPVLYRRALAMALSGEPPTSAVGQIIRNVAKDHPAEAFEFAVQHQRALLENLDASSRWAYIPRLATTSLDPALADKVQAYSERAVPVDARDAAKRTVAFIRQQSATRARQVPALEAWLRDQPPAIGAAR